LPIVEPTSQGSDNQQMQNLRELVGLPTLEVQFKVVVFSSQQTLNQSFCAPLRLFLRLEEDNDGGVTSLTDNLGLGAAETESIRTSYQSLRRLDHDTRSGLADALNELQEIERINACSADLDEFDQAIESQPEKPINYFLRGKKLVELECPIKALASFEKAAELGLDEPELHLERAKILADLQRPEEALVAVERVIEEGSNLGIAYTTKANALRLLNRFKESVDACNMAIEIDPKLALAYVCRGFSLDALNPEGESGALQAFERAIELDAGLEMAYAAP
jgi:tetratricopeptide (TPR) repeat protein